MSLASYIVGAVMAALSFASPTSALASVGFDFGGYLTSPPIPCFHLPGFFLITIIPSGGDPNPFYVYSPSAIGFPPPSHLGQGILGIADIFLACNGVPAQRIQYFGVGL